jgi:hypothetical protein
MPLVRIDLARGKPRGGIGTRGGERSAPARSRYSAGSPRFSGVPAQPGPRRRPGCNHLNDILVAEPCDELSVRAGCAPVAAQGP